MKLTTMQLSNKNFLVILTNGKYSTFAEHKDYKTARKIALQGIQALMI